MAKQKRTHTRRFEAGSRIYYMDAYEDKKGQEYLQVTEQPRGWSAKRKRAKRIIIHREHLDGFLDTLKEISGLIKNGTEG